MAALAALLAVEPVEGLANGFVMLDVGVDADVGEEGELISELIGLEVLVVLEPDVPLPRRLFKSYPDE